MHAVCPACGFVFEPESGFFLGAIYVNYAVTVVIGLGSVLLVDAIWPLPLVWQLALAIPLMLLVPLLCFRHARSVWLALNVLASPELRGQRRREG